MSKLYKNIIGLCESRGISGYRMCKEIGIQPSILTDLKMGRKEGLSSKNADKIARFFGVPVGYLLGTVTLNEDGISFSDGSGFGGGLGAGAGFGNGSGYGGPLPDKKKKTPTVSGEPGIDMSDVDIAFYGGYKELSEDDQKVIRDMVQLMRERRAAKQDK